MADVHTTRQRSFNMSQIRASNTRPEVALRKALWKAGLRYRLNSKLPGKPDVVFVSAKVIIFVDGCFWHGCPKHLVWPRNNAKFWKAKLDGNILRDKNVTRALRREGWLVFRIWEHEVALRLERCARRIVSAVKTRAK